MIGVLPWNAAKLAPYSAIRCRSTASPAHDRVDAGARQRVLLEIPG
jgi:hypothetical protein